MKLGKTIYFDKKIGKIIWVHPKNRFVVVEFSVMTVFGIRRYKQCFKIIQGRIIEIEVSNLMKCINCKYCCKNLGKCYNNISDFYLDFVDDNFKCDKWSEKDLKSEKSNHI